MNIEALCAEPPGAFAHSPSQMPLSCPVVPPSLRELHKDGGGGGDGVARRARRPGPEERWWWWCGRGVQCAVVVAHRWPHMHAPGVDEEGPSEPVRRRWKMAMDKINNFAFPSCAVSFTCPLFTCRPAMAVVRLRHLPSVNTPPSV